MITTMPNMPPLNPVIANNTPLVALWSIDLLPLLRDLYGHILIPPAIYAEFTAIDWPTRQHILDNTSWITTAYLQNPKQALVYVGLDRGEAEVLALAVERSARLVIMDELKGRRYARRLGIPLTGTVGVLLTAKQRGLVPALAPLFDQLKQNGFFLSSSLIHKALQLAGEAD